MCTQIMSSLLEMDWGVFYTNGPRHLKLIANNIHTTVVLFFTEAFFLAEDTRYEAVQEQQHT